MTIKEQAELENLIRNSIHTFADEYLELDECVAVITAHTNKQIARARLNEVQSAYEYWINGRKFISSYFRERIEALQKGEL